MMRRRSTLAAVYSGGLLTIGGLVTVVALPWGLAHYLIPQSIGPGGTSNQPGPPLAYATVFVPGLVYFLWRLVQRAGRPAAELQMA